MPLPVPAFVFAFVSEPESESEPEPGSEPEAETGSESVAVEASERGPTGSRGRRAGTEPPPDTEPTSEPAATDPFADGRERMSRGDLRGAIAAFERAARAQPRNAQVQRQLGRAYMRLGDTRRGAEAYRRYLSLAPDAPDRAIIERLIQ